MKGWQRWWRPDVTRTRAAVLGIWVAALLMAVPAQSAVQTQECLVVGVRDGDTLTARCGELESYQQIRVRLAGIDAPERRQPHGDRARQALASLTFQRWARMDCPKTDRFGRQVCTVWVFRDDGPQDAGQAMVAQGLAWWYRAYAREQPAQQRGLYEAAEQQARSKRDGLWSDPFPIPPWEWRRGARAPK